jgi:hypothetical protein
VKISPISVTCPGLPWGVPWSRWQGFGFVHFVHFVQFVQIVHQIAAATTVSFENRKMVRG